jgi:hypothetical protein
MNGLGAAIVLFIDEDDFEEVLKKERLMMLRK